MVSATPFSLPFLMYTSHTSGVFVQTFCVTDPVLTPLVVQRLLPVVVVVVVVLAVVLVVVVLVVLVVVVVVVVLVVFILIYMFQPAASRAPAVPASVYMRQDALAGSYENPRHLVAWAVRQP